MASIFKITNSLTMLYVKPDIIKIVRFNGLLSSKSKEKIFPISSIIGVEIKEPTFMLAGYIQFQVAGQSSPNNTFQSGKDVFNAVQDENSVMLRKKEEYEIARKIRDYIINYNIKSK